MVSFGHSVYEKQVIGSCCNRKGQLKIKKEAVGTKHIDLWEKLTIDDERSKREYESEMEYIMKGGFLRPCDSSVHQEDWLPPIYPTPPYQYPVRRVFSLALSKTFPFCPFVHLCTLVLLRLHSLGSHLWTPRDTRCMSSSSLYSRFFVCPMSGTRGQLAGDIERGRKVLKRHKGCPPVLKGNDASVTVVIVMAVMVVVVWVVVADSPFDVWKFVLPRDAAATDVLHETRYNVLPMAAFRNNVGRIAC